MHYKVSILVEFGLGGCDSILGKKGDEIRWDQLGICPPEKQTATLHVVTSHMDVLKACLTSKPCPKQEMKSMQSGVNVRDNGRRRIVVYTLFNEDSWNCRVDPLLLSGMYERTIHCNGRSGHYLSL